MNKIELKNFITIAICTNLGAIAMSMIKFTVAASFFMMVTALVLMLSAMFGSDKHKDNQEG